MNEGYTSGMLISGNARLMLITHRTEKHTELDEAKMFYKGGGIWMQIRMKGTLNAEDANTIANLRRFDPERLLCVDDDIEIAFQVGAEGVHLGKKDMPLYEAWQIIDKHDRRDSFFVGATANTFEDIQHAVKEKASYIGLGPYRYTDTKKNLSPVLGLEGYKEIIAKCKEAKYDLPIMAIGGICLEDVGPLMKAGISGITVSGAIINASDPIEETRKFLNEIYKYHPNDTGWYLEDDNKEIEITI